MINKITIIQKQWQQQSNQQTSLQLKNQGSLNHNREES